MMRTKLVYSHSLTLSFRCEGDDRLGCCWERRCQCAAARPKTLDRPDCSNWRWCICRFRQSLFRRRSLASFSTLGLPCTRWPRPIWGRPWGSRPDFDTRRCQRAPEPRKFAHELSCLRRSDQTSNCRGRKEGTASSKRQRTLRFQRESGPWLAPNWKACRNFASLLTGPTAWWCLETRCRFASLCWKPCFPSFPF